MTVGRSSRAMMAVAVTPLENPSVPAGHLPFQERLTGGGGSLLNIRNGYNHIVMCEWAKSIIHADYAA